MVYSNDGFQITVRNSNSNIKLQHHFGASISEARTVLVTHITKTDESDRENIWSVFLRHNSRCANACKSG